MNEPQSPTGLRHGRRLRTLIALGVAPRVEGSGLVRSQSPPAGAALPSTAVVRLR